MTIRSWKPSLACRRIPLVSTTTTIWATTIALCGDSGRPRQAPLYPDQIRVPSWRQENGDKRADPRGRVPGDVFDFTRVTWQLEAATHVAPDTTQRGAGGAVRPHVYHRPERGRRGLTVVDAFGGTGTTLRVCKRIERALHPDRTGPGVLPRRSRKRTGWQMVDTGPGGPATASSVGKSPSLRWPDAGGSHDAGCPHRTMARRSRGPPDPRNRHHRQHSARAAKPAATIAPT